MSMKVDVKISTTLRQYVPGYNPDTGIEQEIAPGTTILDLAQILGIPPGEIKFVMVNGRYQPLETLLGSGDRIAYFPAIGGG